ncbi:MAG: hypothetical protein IKH11_00880 [Bacteroidales bacterium]|nr:hypothetical protein [Bacteroidales bacterium]
MKSAIKIFAVFAAIVMSVSAFAQTAEPEAQPYKVYCQITGSHLIFSETMNVDIDFGQYASWWSTDRRIADQNGKPIIFNSMLDAANYMARRGWSLEEAFVESRVSDSSSTLPRFYWIMSKMVTSDEEVTDGILTMGMFKKR